MFLLEYAVTKDGMAFLIDWFALLGTVVGALITLRATRADDAQVAGYARKKAQTGALIAIGSTILWVFNTANAAGWI